jgi:hypothetical protein
MNLFKAFLTVAVTFFFFQLFAGVKIVTESVEHLNNEKSSGTLLIDGDLIRVETSESGEQSVIYDIAKKEVILINHKDKSWMKMTKKQIDDSKAHIKEQMKAAVAQQQAALAQLAPEQRAQLEAQMQMMMGNENKKPVNYVKTGKTGKWGTGDCEIYEGMRGDIKTEEICTVVPKKLKCSLVEIERLKQISLDYAMDENDVSAWKDVKNMGVPVIHRSFQNGKVVVTNTLVSFENTKIPAESFKVPADYKHTSSPLDSVIPATEKKK